MTPPPEMHVEFTMLYYADIIIKQHALYQYDSFVLFL